MTGGVDHKIVASIAVSKGIEGVVRKDPRNSGPFKRWKPKEISATANGKANNRKIDEEDHFSLQVDFVLIIPRSPFYRWFASNLEGHR